MSEKNQESTPLVLTDISGSVSDWKRRRGTAGAKTLSRLRVEAAEVYTGTTIMRRGVEVTLVRDDGKHLVVLLPGADAVEMLNAIGSVLTYQGVL
jgi:hypothetical protein